MASLQNELDLFNLVILNALNGTSGLAYASTCENCNFAIDRVCIWCWGEHIEWIQAGNSGLNGVIPSELAQLPGLKTLNLSFNPLLSGSLSSDYLPPSMMYFYARGCSLSGDLNGFKFGVMKRFDVSLNRFNGVASVFRSASVQWALTECTLFESSMTEQSCFECPIAINGSASQCASPDPCVDAFMLARCSTSSPSSPSTTPPTPSLAQPPSPLPPTVATVQPPPSLTSYAASSSSSSSPPSALLLGFNATLLVGIAAAILFVCMCTLLVALFVILRRMKRRNNVNKQRPSRRSRQETLEPQQRRSRQGTQTSRRPTLTAATSNSPYQHYQQLHVAPASRTSSFSVNNRPRYGLASPSPYDSPSVKFAAPSSSYDSPSEKFF